MTREEYKKKQDEVCDNCNINRLCESMAITCPQQMTLYYKCEDELTYLLIKNNDKKSGDIRNSIG